jgi:hypothetical protein
MSYSCPERKKIIKNLKESTKINDSSVVKKNSGEIYGSVDWPSIQDAVVKSVMCLVVASAKVKETPGCFC